MQEILGSLSKAFELLISFNADTYGIIFLTLFVTVMSTCVSALFALPCGIVIGSRNFRGKRLIVRLIQTFMGLPPVVVGLVVYMFLSRKGPLGTLHLLFTPTAMIIAQVIIIFPIASGLTIAAVKLKSKVVQETCRGLGLSNFKTLRLLLHECRYPIFSAVLAGYGRAISEVGAVMLVGGNIQYKTRIMTTSIVLETGKGNYDIALAIGIILLLISFLVNWILQKFQEGK